MRTRIAGLVVALTILGMIALASAARAEWTDSGWSISSRDKSNSEYVINEETPGVSAAAPSGEIHFTYADVTYTNTLSANSETYDITIAWAYSLSGTVTSCGSCFSSFDWPNGYLSDGISSAGSYSDGPTPPGNPNTTVSPPGGVVTVTVYASAYGDTDYGCTSTASASGNGSYTP